MKNFSRKFSKLELRKTFHKIQTIKKLIFITLFIYTNNLCRTLCPALSCILFKHRTKRPVKDYILSHKIGIVITLFICACDLPTDPGPLPTTIMEIEFIPGHNILGVLRMDETAGSSFIRVERAYETNEITEEFSAVIDSAVVMVSWADTSVAFEFSQDEKVYLNDSFIPQIGIEYLLSVSSKSLPVLTAATSIEEDITVDQSSITIDNNHVSISFAGLPFLGLYDIYLVSENDRIHQRVSGDSNVVELSFDLDGLNGSPQTIEIYGYDSNLSEYLQSLITFKPQAYHETVTTVENGYGCFGAVRVLKIEL